MASFDEVIEAQLDGLTVAAAHVLTFDFKTEPKRLWPGFGDLYVDGVRFEGVGNIGTLSPISSGPNGGVEEVTASLFGDATMLANLESDVEESIGRELEIAWQFFDLRERDSGGNWVKWKTLSTPVTLFVGRMGPLRPSRTTGDDAKRVISVSAQSIFINRARPSFMFFSDREQKARGAGTDNLCLRISQYSQGEVRWPQF